MKALKTILWAVLVILTGGAVAFLAGKRKARQEDAVAADARQQQADTTAQQVAQETDAMSEEGVRNALAARARRNQQ